MIGVRARLGLTASMLALLVAGCGGGGGTTPVAPDTRAPTDSTDNSGSTNNGSDSGSSGGGTQTPTTPSYVRAADFASHWGLADASVETAYKKGYDGTGVVVAIFDDGVDSRHHDLSGKVVGGYNGYTDAKDGSPIVRQDCDPFGGAACDYGGHGTMIAGAIAGKADGTGVHGVAYGAKVFAVNIDTRANDGAFSYTDAGNAAAWTAARGAGAKIFNHSYGVAYDSAYESFFKSTGGYVGQLLAAARAGGVHVFAAGNAGTAAPNMEAYLPQWHADLQNGALLVVGASYETANGPALASYSNRCGAAKDWCLIAPSASPGNGSTVVTAVAADSTGKTHSVLDPDGDGLTDYVAGTSLAAPFVSGSLALLQEAFPYLKGAELGKILLDTARDAGAPGVDEVYGHGYLDLANAFTPQGGATLIAGNDLTSSARYSLSDSMLETGPALAALAGASTPDAAFFDKYGRAFGVDLGSLLHAANPFGGEIGRLSSALSAQDGGAAEARFGLSAAPGADKLELGLSLASDRNAADAIDPATLFAALRGEAAANPGLEGGFAALVGEEGRAQLRRQMGQGGFMALTAAASRSVYDDQSAAPRTGRVGLDMGWRASANVALGARIGVMRENGGMLGASGEGAFALNGATTSFGEVSAAMRLTPSAQIIARAGLGQSAGGSAALVDIDGDVTTGFARIGLAIDGAAREGDRLMLSAGAPVTALSGSATLHYNTGRAIDGAVTTASKTLSLRPSVLPLEARAEYLTPVGDKTRLGVSAAMMRDAAGEAQGAVTFGLKMDF